MGAVIVVDVGSVTVFKVSAGLCKLVNAKTSVMTIFLLTMNTRFICLAIPVFMAWFPGK